MLARTPNVDSVLSANSGAEFETMLRPGDIRTTRA
jgi:hypothetical protein